MMITAIALALVAAHANSFSLSEVHVRGARVELHLRCQVLSLGEVIEPFDADLDGIADDGEVERYAAEIAEYVEEHYRLFADAESPLRAAESLVIPAPVSLDPMNDVSDWVDVKLTFRKHGRPLTSLRADVDLFLTTSEGHRESTVVVWNGLDLGARQFAREEESHAFVPTEEMLERNQPAFGRYLRMGLVGGSGPFGQRAWSVAALVALLAVGAAAGRSARFVPVLLFAPCLVLGGIVVAQFDPSPAQVRFVELALPLGLAYVAADVLLSSQGRARVLEATLFGVVGGAHAVVRIAPELSTEARVLPGATGYATGLAAAAAVLGTCLAVANAAVLPRGLRVPLALVALAAGLWASWVAYSG